MIMKRRWRWLMLSAIVLLALCVLGLLAKLRIDERAGQRRLSDIEAQLDQNDPRWRYDEIEAARPTLADRDNALRCLATMVKRTDSKQLREWAFIGGSDAQRTPPNCWHQDADYSALAEVLVKNQHALELVTTLAGLPQGQLRITVAPDFVSTNFDECQDVRTAAILLNLLAEQQAKNGQMRPLATTLLSLMNTSRSLGDAPMLLPCLVRLACLNVALKRIERTLALHNDVESLFELQTALFAEAEADLFWQPLRTERAAVNTMFDNIRTRQVALSELIVTQTFGSRARITTRESLKLKCYPYYVALDQAEYLAFMTRLMDARLLPEPDQLGALEQTELGLKDLREGALQLLLARELSKMYSRTYAAAMRTKALSRCAVLAVAVERFRRRVGRWPRNLDELPDQLPATLKRDPYDGQLLRFAQHADGMTIYALGPDRRDNGGTITDGEWPLAEGQDIGFRLYHPNRRGLVALPKVEPLAPIEP